MAEKTKLGNISQLELGSKDAFHVAGIVVRSKTPITSGANIRFVDEPMDEYDHYYTPGATVPTDYVEVCSLEQRQAIADPFLTETVPAYQSFWALPSLDSVVNLTHQFQIKGREREVIELPHGMDKDSIRCALERC